VEETKGERRARLAEEARARMRAKPAWQRAKQASAVVSNARQRERSAQRRSLKVGKLPPDIDEQQRRRRDYHRAYREDNKDRFREWSREYYQRHREEIANRRKAERLGPRGEEVREYKRRYYAQHKRDTAATGLHEQIERDAAAAIAAVITAAPDPLLPAG
jgi:hypothetical protein